MLIEKEKKIEEEKGVVAVLARVGLSSCELDLGGRGFCVALRLSLVHRIRGGGKEAHLLS